MKHCMKLSHRTIKIQSHHPWMLLADDSSALLGPDWQSSPNISVGLSESGVYMINFDIT